MLSNQQTVSLYVVMVCGGALPSQPLPGASLGHGSEGREITRLVARLASAHTSVPVTTAIDLVLLCYALWLLSQGSIVSEAV